MVSPYIVFNRQCEEAINFYEKVFNGQNKVVMRYDDYVPDGIHENVSNYILHATMDIFDTSFTFADELSLPLTPVSMVYLTINPSSVDLGNNIYNKLKEQGEVLLHPTQTFYSPMHTTIRDKFGIQWNIIVIATDQ